jgi:hypothetical protein
MAPARKTKDWLNSPAAEDAADVSAAVSTIDPGSTTPSEPESQQASATNTDWTAELAGACRAHQLIDAVEITNDLRNSTPVEFQVSPQNEELG